MRKLWLIFAQVATVTMAILLALSVLKPNFLSRGNNIVTVKESSAPISAPQSSLALTFRGAAKKAMPSVVNIYTSKKVPAPQHPFMNDPIFRRFFGDRFETEPQTLQSLGSGVIVTTEGFILTNHHVVEAADQIEVALADGRKASARVVGTDPDTDLAVLKIGLTKLPAITFGDSKAAEVGDIVLAIGNPFGVGQTVTMGIISALGRNHLGINTFEDFIQTDAPINPGNSGGALVDINGHLLGINTAIFSRSGGSLGIGFATPVSLAKQVMEQIIKSGAVVRGWIGVEVQDVTPELADSFHLNSAKGTLIAGVLRGGPADKAGIKPGDVLIGFNDKPITDASTMLLLVSSAPPGTKATLKILRDRKELAIPVEIGKRPRTAQQPQPQMEENQSPG